MRLSWVARGLVGLSLPLFLSGLWGADAPVAKAAARGDIEAVRQLLRQGVDVNTPQGDGMTALHWAADRGDAELAQVLIYAGANLEAGTRIGRYTPLHIASRRARLEVVRTLLEANADPNAQTTNSEATPLHLAAASGDPEVLSALLAAGAQINPREASWEQPPLVFAASNGHSEAVRMLLGAGADPAMTSRVVNTAEQEEADKAAERRISEFLTDFREKEGGGANWQPTPSQVQAAIEAARAIQRKWPDVPRPAARQGRGGNPAQEAGRPNAKTGNDSEGEAKNQAPGGVPDKSAKADDSKAKAERPVQRLQRNAKADQPEISSAPVKYDAEGNPVYDSPEPADPKQPKSQSYGQMVGFWGGLTPLLHAVRQGHRETALALLEGGADINQPSAGDKTTPLLMAAINGQFDLALTLLQKGADPNLTSIAGTTPLFAVLERTWAPKASYSHPTEHLQQKATHLEAMKALLKAGADPNVRLKSHLWYMEYTFGVLRGAGIHLKGATPLWRAAHALDVEAMRLLKEHGADPNIPTIKPPQRRRRRPQESDEKPKAEGPKTEEKPGKDKDEGVAKLAQGDKPDKPAQTKAEATESEKKGNGEKKEEDLSGVPPIPVGGPAIYPIHAVSGVGYGQSFAGNAHRHVPDNWLAAVKFLVEECGANVNLRDHNAYTPLHHAASRGDNELILYLIEKGADVTVLSRKGQTPADMANGPIQRVSPYPETVALLEKLGSKNNHKCVSC